MYKKWLDLRYNVDTSLPKFIEIVIFVYSQLGGGGSDK